MQPENEKGEWSLMSVFSAAWLLKVTDPGTWSLPVSVRGLGGFQHSRTLDALESWTVSRVALQIRSPSEARKPLPALPSAPAPGLQQTDRHFSNVPRFLISIYFWHSLVKSLVEAISTKF